MNTTSALALVLASTGFNQVEVSKLCEVEQTMVHSIETGDATNFDLLGYYEAANSRLFEHLNRLIEKYDAGVRESGATYIMGDPGLGTSYVSRVIDPFSAGRCRLELENLTSWADLGFHVEPRPDLVSIDGKTVFNELPAIIVKAKEFSIEKLFAARALGSDGKYKPLIVIDDLDEVHPETSRLILNSLEALLAKRTEADGYLHVVVLGRPEAFVTKPSARVKTFVLSGPRYRTTGDLRYLFGNYFTFFEIPEPDEAEFHRFTNLVESFDFLSYSLGNLALLNFFIERSLTGKAQTEEDLKSFLYESLIERNQAKNGRSARHEKVYGELLQEAAFEYAEAVGANGVFSVDEAAVVQIGDLAVHTRDLLDRSGIAVRDRVAGQYRFTPLWVQRHLIQLRSKRLDPDYVYASCP